MKGNRYVCAVLPMTQAIFRLYIFEYQIITFELLCIYDKYY
jgi:hypothetical protein